MFIDASALVAMLTEDDHGDNLAARMHIAKNRLTSPIAVWETTLCVARFFDMPVSEAKVIVENFIEAQAIQIVSLTPKTGSIAIDAYDSFGKGRHPASLNFGDCMAYACAKAYRRPLLFNGTHYSKTDIQPA